MFALLISPEYGLPVIVSMNSCDYKDFLWAGYIEKDTGSKKEMLELQDSILEEIYCPSLNFMP